MTTLLISLAAFVGVAALVGSASLMFRGDQENKVEDRLSELANWGKPGQDGKGKKKLSLLSEMQRVPNIFDEAVKRLGNLGQIFEQADTTMTADKFFLISGAMAAVAGLGMLFSPLSPLFAPVVGGMAGLLPTVWLVMRRKRRLAKFAAQLPGALELISRALRAGHSLGSGMKLVADESQPPIAKEFSKVFESQNLGISMDDSLKALTVRVPNLDLKFFATAIILQRQTGGDLAEILDKIGHLIRERFKIWGQVQALTGEGRLSGIVLLALPPLLFLAVYYLNPEYCMVLFTDAMGQKMLAAAVFLQFVGALVIKKIINIKV
ncbi:MAG: type II secretion system F family protein [Pirellulales bacterium]